MKIAPGQRPPAPPQRDAQHPKGGTAGREHYGREHGVEILILLLLLIVIVAVGVGGFSDGPLGKHQAKSAGWTWDDRR